MQAKCLVLPHVSGCERACASISAATAIDRLLVQRNIPKTRADHDCKDEGRRDGQQR